MGKELIELIRRDREIISNKLARQKYVHVIYNKLCEAPLISISELSRTLNIEYTSAKRNLKSLEQAGIVDIYKMNEKVVIYRDYMTVLRKESE
jgi:predicted transcriptional regulator